MNDRPKSIRSGEALTARYRRGLVWAAFAFVVLISFLIGWILSENWQAAKHKAGQSIQTSQVASQALGGTQKGINAKGDGTLAYILAKYAGGERIAAVAKLVGDTPVAALGKLIDEAWKCPSAELRQLVYDLAYAKWVAADAAAALAHAYQQALKTGKPDQLPNLFSVWGKIDPQAALAAAVKLGRISFRQAAITRVMTSWVQGGDPLAAVAAVKALPKTLVAGDLLQGVFKSWAEVDPAAAWANLAKIDNAKTLRTVQGDIIATLAASNPVQALDLLRGLPVGQQTTQLYNAVFAAWGGQNPADALAVLKEFPAGNIRSQAIASIFAGWAESDPLSALKTAESFPPGVERAKALQASLDSLAAQNPPAAADYIAHIAPGASRTALVTSLAEKWADSDPAAALAWLEKNALGADYDVAVGKVLGQLSKTDPRSAVNYIAQLPMGTKHDAYLQDTIASWAGQDPGAALAWVNGNLSSTMRDAAMSMVLRQLISTDAVGAVNYLPELPKGAIRDQLFNSAGVALAEQNPQAALEWANALPEFANTLSRENTLKRLMDTLANSDPTGTAAYISQHPDSVNFAEEAVRLASTWAKNDGASALAWAASLPAGSTRDNAITSAITNLAIYDPEAAISYAQGLPEGDSRTAALGEAIKGWSQTSPADAVKALADLPAGPIHIEATRGIVQNWINLDPQAVSQWMTTLPHGSVERELSINLLVTRQAANDPEAAFAWAITTDSLLNRAANVDTVMAAWAQRDAPAAIAALEKAPISDDARATILRRIQQVQANPHPATNSNSTFHSSF